MMPRISEPVGASPSATPVTSSMPATHTATQSSFLAVSFSPNSSADASVTNTGIM